MGFEISIEQHFFPHAVSQCHDKPCTVSADCFCPRKALHHLCEGRCGQPPAGMYPPQPSCKFLSGTGTDHAPELPSEVFSTQLSHRLCATPTPCGFDRAASAPPCWVPGWAGWMGSVPSAFPSHACLARFSKRVACQFCFGEPTMLALKILEDGRAETGYALMGLHQDFLLGHPHMAKDQTPQTLQHQSGHSTRICFPHLLHLKSSQQPSEQPPSSCIFSPQQIGVWHWLFTRSPEPMQSMMICLAITHAQSSHHQ